MVHKKSEYRLQFHLLEKDIRKQIWQENIQFRETCRSLNQADHYWSYQLTDERCECELEEVDEDEAALPPHKLKHKILLAQYGSAKSETQDVQKVQEFPSPSIKQRGTPAQVQLEESKDARDIAVQTPDWEAQERRLEDYVQNEDKNLTQNNNSALQKSGKEQKKETQTLIKSYLPVTQSITIQDPNSQSRASNKAERCDTATSHGQHSGVSQTSGLTRTSRKAYFEEKKSPFVSFGWNDSDRNVGDKKTYNVHAPEHEVYPPAILALKRRREGIERYLAEEAEKRRQELTSRSATAVNHSSIWMTEYQENFTHGNKFLSGSSIRRPTSAPPCRKSTGWRYS